MKHNFFIYITFLFVIIYGCTGRTGKSVAGIGGEQDSTEIVFTKEIHDLGVITSGESVKCSFEFFNNGKNPLLIQQVVAGCGCTNVKFPKKPISPKQKGTIEVTFNSTGRQGHQRKTINVISNGSEMPIMLVIIANVEPNN